jgi:hypothetical protein
MTFLVQSGMRPALLLLVYLAAPHAILAQSATPLAERFEPGLRQHVSVRVKLSGELLVPVDKDKPPKKVPMNGESTIEYDERLLPADTNPDEQRSLRIYRQMDFGRTIGDRKQEMNLRSDVRKIIVGKTGRLKNFFSPDGPLTWGEIDLLRTDLFTPVLAGLLPSQPVKPGDSWKGSEAAAVELTDMEKVEDGHLECRLEEITTIAGRRVAHIKLSGTLRGVNEDGPNRQSLAGTLYFDLESNHLSYLSFKGVHELLDKDGQTAGTIEGQFVLTRTLSPATRDLADEAISRLTLEPNAENTLLLYDNPDLGVRFLYPRRWRVGRENGPQLTLDAPDGNGILITLEALKRLPTADAYLQETTDYLTQQKAKLVALDRPRRLVEGANELDHFALQMELGGQKVVMSYFVARQARGGATMAARLLDRDRGVLQKEVERIARSLTVTRDFGGR